MRTAITIGVLHGGQTSKVLHGPEVPIADQMSAFKQLPSHKGPHNDFERIEVWDSGSGVVKTSRFVTPDAHAAMLKDHARQRQEFEAAEKLREAKNKPTTTEAPPKAEPDLESDPKGKKSKPAKAD